MSDKKRKARPDAATSEQAAGADYAGHDPCLDFTTESSEKQEQEFTLVSDLLHQGRENGLTLHDLVRLTGLGEREIRRRIHIERKTGQLIMSDCKNGYFLPEGSRDIQQFARSMCHRAGEIMAIARAAESAAAEAEGQSSFEGW